MATTYGSAPIPLAPGNHVDVIAEGGFTGLSAASEHTVQVVGAGTLTVSARLRGMTDFSPVGDPVQASLYTFNAHNLNAIRLHNTGAEAITVAVAGG